MCVCTCVCMYMHTCVYVCLCIRTHASFMCMHKCIHVHMCVHVKICVYSYVSMHTYVYIHSVCVFNTNQMLAWSIYLFPLCFKSGKSMFPILCAEGLHGTYEHINLRQVSLIKEAY